MSDANGNGERGVEHVKVPTIIITLDPGTLIVSYKCDGLPIAVAQMMVDEVRRTLDIQRRQAAAIQLQQQVAEQRRAGALADSLFRR